MLAQIAETRDSSPQDGQSSSTPTLSTSLSETVRILAKKTAIGPQETQSTRTRLILFVSDDRREFDDSWAYIDSNGAHVSLPDHLDNLVSENNAKAQTDPTLLKIEHVEFSIVILVSELPSRPSPPSSSSDPVIDPLAANSSASENPNQAQESTQKTSGESSAVASTDTMNDQSVANSNATYHHNPSCFSDGTDLPPSKLIGAGLNFVTSDLNVVRPSFIQQAIIDLACSHYSLSQVAVLNAPLRDQIVGAPETCTTPGFFLLPNSSSHFNIKKHITATDIRPHIGKILGTGSNFEKTFFWKPWEPQLSIHGLPCNDLVRITTVYPTHRASISIIASALEGRPILLASRPVDPVSPQSTPPSCILMCHGNYIYAHKLREYDDVSLWNTAPKEVSPLHEPSSRNMRLGSIANLLLSNTFNWTISNTYSEFQPIGNKYERSNAMNHSVDVGPSGKSIDFSKTKVNGENTSLTRTRGTAKYLTTRLLEVWTRIFPLFEEDTVCYASTLTEALEKEVMPILLSMTSENLLLEHVPVLLQCVDNLSQYAQNNDPYLFPHTRAAVAKRRELYVQLWTELLYIGVQYSDLSENHLLVSQRIRASAPDQALATAVFRTKKVIGKATIDSNAKKAGNNNAEMMVVDADSPVDREQAQREAEAQWMRDVASARHDIVGLKDISWSGAKMDSTPTAPVTSTMNPASLYSRYWDQARPKKQF